MRQNLIRHHSVWPFSSPLKREACCPSGQAPPPPRTSTPPEASTRLRGPLGRPPPDRDRVLSVHKCPQRPQGRAPISEPATPNPGARPGRAGSPSRPHLPQRFRRKRPTFLRPPSAPTGARIQPPSRAGGRHNRRPAQTLPRREASWLENMMLWHLLCKYAGPTPPRGGRKKGRALWAWPWVERMELSGGDRPGWPQPDRKAQQTGSIRWLKPGGRPLRPIHATSAQRYG